MKAIVVFPGNGSQYIGMGKRLCEKHEIAARLFQQANEVLGYDLQKLCISGRLTELSKNENSQPAILTIGLIMYKAYIEANGIEPVLAAGHSLGEYTALVCGNVMCFEDALKIVHRRGREIDQVKGGMTLVNNATLAYAESLCSSIRKKGGNISISCINSDRQFTLSGTGDSIQEAEDRMASDGMNFTMLHRSVPSHCELLAGVSEVLKTELAKYPFQDSRFPVVSNCTGEPDFRKEILVENLKKQLIMPVLWKKSVDRMKSCHADLCIELGPKTVLRDLLIPEKAAAYIWSMDHEKDRQRFHELLSGRRMEPCRGSAILKTCIRELTVTKNYNRTASKEQYQADAGEKYRSLIRLYEEVTVQGRALKEAEILYVLDTAKRILDFRNVPDEIKEARMSKIMDKL